MTQFGGEKRHAVWSEKLKIKKGKISRRLKRKQARRFEQKKHAVIAKFAPTHQMNKRGNLQNVDYHFFYP